jgi:hypothetical protein
MARAGREGVTFHGISQHPGRLLGGDVEDGGAVREAGHVHVQGLPPAWPKLPSPPTSMSPVLSTMVTRFASAETVKVDGRFGFQDVVVITDGNKITVTDPHGEILIEHTRAAPAVTYVGNGRRPGGRSQTTETSPKS